MREIKEESVGEDTGRHLRPILRRFHTSLEDIEASAIISGDGLPLATVLEDDVDADRFGAMCASLLALAGQAADEISRGRLRQVLVGGEEGSMLLVQAGPNTVLGVAVRPQASLGRVFLETRKAAAAVESATNSPAA